jgi:YD repeat-containing protein
MTAIEHKDGATALDGYTYGLDAQGDITRTTHQDGSYWDYTYDGRQRLITAVRNNSGATIAAKYYYTYDAGDNLVTKKTPFSDDFNDGDYTGWTVSYGTWDASNHYLTCGSSTARAVPAQRPIRRQGCIVVYTTNTNAPAKKEQKHKTHQKVVHPFPAGALSNHTKVC